MMSVPSRVQFRSNERISKGGNSGRIMTLKILYINSQHFFEISDAYENRYIIDSSWEIISCVTCDSFIYTLLSINLSTTEDITQSMAETKAHH